MPVEVIKYTCVFRCGQKASGKKSAIAGHEMKCWNNPVNQTCKTCSNEKYNIETDGEVFSTKYAVRGCKIKEIDSVLEDLHDVMGHQNSIHVRPIYHCPYWNKETDENAETFANDLRSEIDGQDEGTIHYPFYNKPDKVTEPISPDNLPF